MQVDRGHIHSRTVRLTSANDKQKEKKLKEDKYKAQTSKTAKQYDERAESENGYSHSNL